MKILVTGGAGFIGSHIVDACIEAGHEVVVLDDLSTGKEGNLNRHAKFYNIDIRSEEILRLFTSERPDIVNHHAAQVNVRRSTTNPIFDANTNVIGSINVLEAARLSGTRHILFSSSGGAVYGNPNYLPCDELHPIQPLSQYGVSKYTAEQYILAYHRQFGINYTILRYANVFGPRQDPNGEAGVVAIFIGSMLGGHMPTIYGSGEQERDFIFVGDCVRANLLAQEKETVGTFNIGTGNGTSVNDLYSVLQGVTGFREEPIHIPAIPGEVFKTRLDISKSDGVMGWRSDVSLQDGLALTVDSIRESIR